MSMQRAWSCDSFVVGSSTSGLGVPLLGKNSDRPVRECQPLRRHPSRRGGGLLRLSHIQIEDVEETIPHLGSSPYWGWGHEMGINAAGLAIGNEAIFTRDWAARVAREKAGERETPGLTGMELLRLALERAATARRGVEVIGRLLEQHGQWAAATVTQVRADATYDNAFLLVDPNEAWTLETTGRDWAARRVTTPTHALSNQPSIRTQWDLASGGLEYHLHEQGGQRSQLDFAEIVTDPMTPLQVSQIRVSRSTSLLRELEGPRRVGFREARQVLSDHYEGTFLGGPFFNPARPDFLSLCMHASPAGFTWGNTAASMIAIADAAAPMMWWAPVTPCTSIYLPATVAGDSWPEALARSGTARPGSCSAEDAPVDRPSDDSYWWTFMRLLEVTAGDELGSAYQRRQPVVREVLDPLQEDVLAAAERLTATRAGREEWADLTDQATRQALTAARSLIRRFQGER